MLKTRIDRDWLFWKDGCEQAKKAVTLPHDAMIGEARDKAMEGGAASGFFPGGKYFYEKHLFGAPEYAGKRVIAEFEGAYMDSAVTLNGKKVGGHYYGYTNFFCDLTDALVIGQDNVLQVVCDNSKTPNSRWYSGSGIYRPVNIWVGGKDGLLPGSVKVSTVSLTPAVISVEVADAPENAELCMTILENGQVVAEKTLPAGDHRAQIEIPNGKCWSHQTPNLYTLVTRVLQDGRECDRDETRFGIRTLSWGAGCGFQVNGETIKLRGGCVHHEHGIVGAAAFDESEKRRILKLKELGFNAIRYSHNPAGKNFLDLCDELGMYVVDESFDQWKLAQSPCDYSTHFDAEWQGDVESMVLKDFNHPCVIMYGIGNEITDVGLPFGPAIARMIADKFKSLDPSRPTMLANNHMLTILADMKMKAAAAAKEKKDEITGSNEVNAIVAMLPKIAATTDATKLEAIAKASFDTVDIVGYNYGGTLYKNTHELAPDRVILSSETFPKRMAVNWKLVDHNDFVIGDFLWTAWDYLGEAGVGMPVYGTDNAPFSKDYPCICASCGNVDLTGAPEAQGIYNAVLFGSYDKPYIAVRPVNHSGEAYCLGNWRLTDAIPCWTWDGCEGKDATVFVYSVGKETALYQDGQLVDRKPLADCMAEFTVAFRAGTLEAVSYDASGAEIARTTLTTAGKESCLHVRPEVSSIRADGESIAYVPVELTDKDGVLKMTTDVKVALTVSGPAELLGFGSGRCETEERFDAGEYTTWHGRALAIIRSTGAAGDITITATAGDLTASACLAAK